MKRFREKPEITLNTVVQRDPAQEFSKIDDEVVMLSLKNGEYYALNPVASRIWELIGQKKNVGEITEILIQEYEVDHETCMTDTLECLQDLRNKALLINP